MLEASTTGHAQPKHKTINAEVNLLSEWQRKRDSLSEQITRTAIVLTLITLVALGSAPFLIRSFVVSNQRLHLAEQALDGNTAELAKREIAKKSAIPILDQGAMHDTAVREGKQFLGHTMSVINSAEAGMAFESVSANVIGGELTVDCKADAESNSVVQAFLDRAGKDQGAKTTLLRTAEKNGKLSADGIGFEYVSTFEVSP